MKRIIIGAWLLALVGSATGCATAARSTERATVCPQCKVVTIARSAPVFEGEGSLPPWQKEGIETQHSCPGCQGALTTFFKERQMRHKCSICEQTPFSCPIEHR